jgi:hypothetical protein
MKYLLTVLAVAVAALALAAGTLSATGEAAQLKHATMHVEQLGPKYLTPQVKHATMHLEQLGPKYLPGS